MSNYVVNLADCGMRDVASIGGKNASLGEMIRELTEAGVSVPPGFATTATAFRDFLAQGGLDSTINNELEGLDVDDVEALTACGARIREAIRQTPMQQPLKTAT